MIILEEHIVPPHIHSSRLADYAPKVFKTLATKSAIKKAIKKQLILVDDAIGKTGTWVKEGQKLILLDENKIPEKIYQLSFEVVFEDEHLALINKPSGIPTSGNQFRTVTNSLLNNISLSNLPDKLNQPYPVHRLDSATSGLLLIAKTNQSRRHLSQQFEQKTIQKKYRAIAIGTTKPEGYFDTPIQNKDSYTSYKTIKTTPSLKNGSLSLVELYPQTGRTHQLRIHLSEHGTPILGDSLYGREGLILKSKGLFLCATAIAFLHPFTKKEMLFSIPHPYKFDSLMDRELRRWNKYHIDN